MLYIHPLMQLLATLAGIYALFLGLGPFPLPASGSQGSPLPGTVMPWSAQRRF